MTDFASVRLTETLSTSELEILRIVRRAGPIARSEVTQKTTLTQQSVHRIIDNLEKRGFLKFGDPKISGPGKPSPTVSLDPSRYASIGISVSGGHTRGCMLDISGKPVIEEVIGSGESPADTLHNLALKLSDWLNRPAQAPTIVGIGVCMQGFRAGKRDVFYTPDPLAAWQGLALEDWLQTGLGLTAFAENNATASALAEHYLGAGRAYPSLAFFSFDHGFGMGSINNGSVLLGGHGNAGEIGALFTPEQKAHRPALGELILRLAAHGIEVANVHELARRFDPDWPGLADWLGEVTPLLQLSLRAVQSTTDPQAIFFGGSAPAPLRQMLIEAGKGAFIDLRMPTPALLPSALEGDASHLGAAMLPLHELVF